MRPYTVLLILLLAQLQSSICLAQHSIDVQRLSASDEHFKAMVAFDKLPRRRTTTDAVIAAGRSAWALGLPERAVKEFEKALQDDSLEDSARARLYLSRGIIEYQEERYRVAILFAEKVVELLPAGPLRSRAWLLWGESLSKLESYGAAQAKYLSALEESDPENAGDVHYALGRCELKLGNLEDAQSNFEKIPLSDARTPRAMRYLAEIALQREQYDHAAFWLDRGRESFPDKFLNSWVDYALMRIAINQNDQDSAKQLYQQALQKYPPSDDWFTLLEAELEEYQWSNNQGQEKK